MAEYKQKIVAILVIVQHKISRIQTRDIGNKQNKEDALKYIKEVMELLV